MRNPDSFKNGIGKALNDGYVDIESAVSEVLFDLGVSANLRGYQYLYTAICLCINDPSYIKNVTTRLYPDVAEECMSTKQKVERCMRGAIESACCKRGIRSIGEYFGYTMNPGKGKPTNSEFIALIAQRIRTSRKNI